MEIPTYPNQEFYCDPATQEELDNLREIVSAIQRLIANAETIVIQSGTRTPYTPKIVYASDLEGVLSGKLR